jgi:hypothetical protein
MQFSFPEYDTEMAMSPKRHQGKSDAEMYLTMLMLMSTKTSSWQNRRRNGLYFDVD